MSIKVMTQVWAYAKVSGSELLVLLAMADFADDEGRNIYPSMPTLAKKSRLSESQARRVMQHLSDEMGMIEVVEAGGFVRGRNRSNEYRILLDSPNLLPDGGGSIMTPPSADARSSRGREGGGVTGARGGGVIAMTPDPSFDPPSLPIGKDDDDKAATAAFVSEKAKATTSSNYPEPIKANDPEREAYLSAWRENMPQELNAHLNIRLSSLQDEVGAAAIIHGIAAAVEHDKRNFAYVATCARNHAAGVQKPVKASRRKKVENEPEDYTDLHDRYGQYSTTLEPRK